MSDQKLEDAKACLKLFRETISAESYEKYCGFLKHFYNQEIDLEVFIAGIMDLTKGHDGLVPEFNKFMPGIYALPSHQVGSSSSSATESDDHTHDDDHNPRNTHDEPRKDQEVSPGGCDNGNNDSAPSKSSKSRKKKIWEINSYKKRRSECEKFLYRVRKLVDNVDTFRNFLELMNDYQVHKDLDRLDREVLRLFRDEPGLHIEFSIFLVDAIEAREKELERSSSIEAGENSEKDEGVRRSKVMEKRPHNENLCRVEDATADNMDMIDSLNKDSDLYCVEDIADLLTKSPVRKIKCVSEMQNSEPPVKKPQSTALQTRRIKASEEETRDSQPKVKKRKSPNTELALTDKAATEKIQRADKWRDEFMNNSPEGNKIKASDGNAPDYFELAFKKRRSSSPELAVAGAATELPLGENNRADEDFIDTELRLSLPGLDKNVPDYEHTVKNQKGSSRPA